MPPSDGGGVEEDSKVEPVETLMLTSGQSVQSETQGDRDVLGSGMRVLGLESREVLLPQVAL